MGATQLTLNSFLAYMTDLITNVSTWLGSVIAAITANPVLVVLAVFGILSVVFGIVLRFVRSAG